MERTEHQCDWVSKTEHVTEERKVNQQRGRVKKEKYLEQET